MPTTVTFVIGGISKGMIVGDLNFTFHIALTSSHSQLLFIHHINVQLLAGM